ncbi:CAP domain-containing protein [Actinoplanes sp. NPDC051851]|uniref:CAP domain-containing protein n=1 Tax=Actinoplanes sp. NPDC051851 TaxID=3154753 RepID=UPI0034413EEF
MLEKVARRVVLLAATPALLALPTAVLGQGPAVPVRPAEVLPTETATTPPGDSLTTTPTAPVTPEPDTEAETEKASTKTLTRQMVRLTNHERKAAGCPKVSVDHELNVASTEQSYYMARTRLFSHVWRDGSTFVTRTQRAGYRAPAGENIAWGYPTAKQVVEAWMNSPGHRANILNCAARSIGAAITYAADGTPYYTQVFGYR